MTPDSLEVPDPSSSVCVGLCDGHGFISTCPSSIQISLRDVEIRTRNVHGHHQSRDVKILCDYHGTIQEH